MDPQHPFLVYKSSAGSGKTTALINIFLNLILSEPDPGHFKRVLAITFTNKATNEMKTRLLEELIKISGMKLPYDANSEGFMVKAVLKATELEPGELKRRARDTFVRILFDYGDLSISTIDRFNHKLIRAFSKELELRADFAVELDDVTLFKEAVIRMVERVGHDETLTEHLTNYIAAAQNDERRADITRNLESLRPLIMNEEADAPMEALREIDAETFKSIVGEMSEYCGKIETEFRTLGRNAKKLLDDAGASADDLPGKKTNSWYSYFKKCTTDPIETLTISVTRRKNAEKKWAHKDAHPATAAAIDAVTDRLVEFAEKAIHLVDNELPAYLLRKAVLKKIHLLGTLNELREVLDEITEERNILPISYFNRLVSRHLRDEPAAFIYENIGARYANILIDEFQDTSAMQWLNLLPLVGEALATNNTVLVVGDAKQSIYRWRGGKAEQLISLPEIDDPVGIIPSELKARLKATHEIIPLNTNYRSAKRIIAFNNALFEALKPELTGAESLYKKAYDDVAQQIPESNEKPGYVEVNYLGPKADDEIENKLLLEQINDLRKRGVPLSDVCILVRTKKEGKQISEFLESNKVSVTTSDSRSIDADARVQMITAFLKLNVKPDDNPSKISVMRCLTSLHGLPFNPDKFSVRSNRNRHIDLRAFLKSARLPVPKSEWFAQGAYQACETLINIYLPESRTAASLTSLLNYIVAKGGMNLTAEDFMQHWESAKDKPGAGAVENSESIRMMTIHKCKGLQFRVVIFPSVNWKLAGGGYNESWVRVDHLIKNGLVHAPLNISSKLEGMGLGEVHEQESSANDFDNLNMIYVALTRAESALYVNYTDSNKGSAGSKFRAAMEVVEAEHNRLEGSEIHSLGSCLGDFDHELDPSASRFAWGKPPEGLEKTKEKDQNQTEKLHKAKANTEPWFERFQFAYDPKSTGKNISQKLGIFFHRLAAETADLKEGRAWIDVRNRNGEIDTEEKVRLTELTEMLYADEKYRSITSKGKRLAERELIYNGEVMRPDLVFETDDEATVIDFKTGEEKESHFSQLVRYKTALQKATGKPTAGFLLYLDPMKWVEVTEMDATSGSSPQMKLF